jgi:hypothetical protein
LRSIQTFRGSVVKPDSRGAAAPEDENRAHAQSGKQSSGPINIDRKSQRCADRSIRGSLTICQKATSQNFERNFAIRQKQSEGGRYPEKLSQRAMHVGENAHIY